MPSPQQAQMASKPYQYQNQGGADVGAQQGINTIVGNNYAAPNQPAANNIAGGVAKNVTDSGQAYDTGASQYAGSALTGYAPQLLPYATQTLQTGFDPQHQLYNQQFQQNTDQTRATEAAQGVAGTPYGAGLETKSNQDFDLNWQNAQLGRQQTAAGTAGSLLGSAGGAAQTGTGIGQSIGTNALSNILQSDQAGQYANNSTQTAVQDFLAYLSGGTSANNAATGATQATNQGRAQNNSANNAWLQDIGQGIGFGTSFLPI